MKYQDETLQPDSRYTLGKRNSWSGMKKLNAALLFIAESRTGTVLMVVHNCRGAVELYQIQFCSHVVMGRTWSRSREVIERDDSSAVLAM